MDDHKPAPLENGMPVRHRIVPQELVFEDKPNVRDYEMDLWEVICIRADDA